MLFVKVNHTYTHNFENNKNSNTYEVQIQLLDVSLFGAPFWEMHSDTMESYYLEFFPDLNGDSRPDFIYSGDDSGKLVRDGGTGKAYSKIPTNCEYLRKILYTEPKKPPILVYLTSNYDNSYQFLSFGGLEVPAGGVEDSNPLGTEYGFGWQLAIFAFISGMLVRMQRVKIK